MDVEGLLVIELRQSNATKLGLARTPGFVPDAWPFLPDFFAGILDCSRHLVSQLDLSLLDGRLHHLSSCS